MLPATLTFSGAMRQFLLEGAVEFIQEDGVPGINVKLGARRILLNKNKRLHYAKQRLARAWRAAADGD